jgi:hypothetical protein
MGDVSNWAERRASLRVPVRGDAVVHAHGAGDDAMHGTIENLSHTGVLMSVAQRPIECDFEVDLRLNGGAGRGRARAVRVEAVAQRWHVAVELYDIDDALRDVIDASIMSAVFASRRRPILVIDDQAERRRDLHAKLVARGMTPLTPTTPLQAIDLLTRAQLNVTVCLLGAGRPGSFGGYGVAQADLRTVLVDSFPWVTTTEISDDVDDTVGRAVTAWSATDVARLGVAIG